MTSTDLDVVEGFHRSVGVGHINGPTVDRRGDRKLQWRFKAGRLADVQQVASLLGPWLCSRRLDQAERVVGQPLQTAWLLDRDCRDAWVAGFWEGEGSFYLTRSRTRIRLAGKIHSTDLEPLERVRDLTGVGRIYGPYQGRGLGWQPQWQLRIDNRHHVVDLMEQLRPWFGSRRVARVDDLLAA